jgi:hypothetical protein
VAKASADLNDERPYQVPPEITIFIRRQRMLASRQHAPAVLNIRSHRVVHNKLWPDSPMRRHLAEDTI